MFAFLVSIMPQTLSFSAPSLPASSLPVLGSCLKLPRLTPLPSYLSHPHRAPGVCLVDGKGARRTERGRQRSVRFWGQQRSETFMLLLLIALSSHTPPINKDNKQDTSTITGGSHVPIDALLLSLAGWCAIRACLAPSEKRRTFSSCFLPSLPPSLLLD